MMRNRQTGTFIPSLNDDVRLAILGKRQYSKIDSTNGNRYVINAIK
jgi:hypothetical protein